MAEYVSLRVNGLHISNIPPVLNTAQSAILHSWLRYALRGRKKVFEQLKQEYEQAQQAPDEEEEPDG